MEMYEGNGYFYSEGNFYLIWTKQDTTATYCNNMKVVMWW